MSMSRMMNGRRWMAASLIALACALLFTAAPRPLAPVPVASAQIGGLQVSAGGPYAGQVGQTIVFTAQVSLGGQFVTTPVQFQWSFGDGGTGFGQTTTHAYGAAGTYTVTVSAQTATGLSAFASTSAQIGTSGQGQLQVSAGGPYSGQVGVPIVFTAQVFSGFLQAGVAVQVQWSFGDGGTGFGQSTTYTYSAAGTYTVTVTVLTATGLAGTASTTAVVGGTATVTTPSGTEQVTLYASCNNVSLTWPNGTSITIVVSAVNPPGAIIAIWHFDNIGQRFAGYSSSPGAPNDLTTVNKADPVYICMNTAGILTRPVI